MKTIIAAIITTTFAMGTAFAQTPVTGASEKLATPAVVTAAKSASVSSTTSTAPTAPAAVTAASSASNPKGFEAGTKNNMKHHMGSKKGAE
ncbi:hypothetical protein H8K32_10450 [Undibacterium jejuense]|uniref:Uncharacterized protein n=1 Tax=Undibacterium jejuense TaxID=1344949 RepID=A0A923HI10_9BURK|nr:hypothetical protein [Undibacterium jejuense]MBC3862520.1 hypothetical protein [Undibacterium jejuense]